MAGLYFSVGADFSKLSRLKKDIDNAEVLLRKEEAHKLIELLIQNKDNCEKLRAIYNECIRFYGLLCEDISDKAKKKYIDYINELIQESDKYIETNLIETFTRQTETSELCNIYDEENVLWNDIAQKGIILSNTYISSIDKVENILDGGIKNIEDKSSCI